MLRRFLVLAFALLCLFASTGLSLQQHYCGGNLASVNFVLPGSAEKDACGECGMKAGSADCCKNVLTFVKSPETGRYFNAVTGFSFIDWVGPEAVAFFSLPAECSFTAGALKATPLVRPPPLLGSPPQYVRNCVFLI